MSNKIYAGIGSRETPKEVLEEMQTLARCLAIRGWLLRSGGAQGADSAFERGCDQGNGRKEIYLPWFRFNGNTSRLCNPSEDAFATAGQLLERFQFLTLPVKKLHARNVHQVLGQACDSPADLIICWTPNGAPIGGTATAIQLSYELDIPVLNMGINNQFTQWGSGTTFKRLELLGITV